MHREHKAWQRKIQISWISFGHKAKIWAYKEYKASPTRNKKELIITIHENSIHMNVTNMDRIWISTTYWNIVWLINWTKTGGWKNEREHKQQTKQWWKKVQQHSHTNITGYRQRHHIVTGWTQRVSSSTKQQTNTTGSIQYCDDKLECISEHEVRS